uniref:Cathepsin propeptide inhibitor domain-containing protein n=1 Tax=Triticum urartu TaxID=4572 RepID=A0A8R7PPQ0_TRIUA
MASIMSKLARAALATRASPSAVGGIASGCRPAATIRVSPAEKARPKSQVAPDDEIMHPHLAVNENALKSDEAMWAFYEQWCKFHGISWDRTEMERMFKIFSDTARLVHKMNNSLVDGELSMTKFSDRTKEERSRLLGSRRT